MHYNWEYGDLASRTYELDKPVGRSLNGDIEFYTQQLANVTGEILEPAVGTGRILIPLLQQGLQVRGYDSSESMLAICHHNLSTAGLKADVTTANMETYLQPETFAAIIVPTGSIILLRDRSTVTDALRNMHDSLRPGGQLFIDVPPGRLTSAPMPMRHFWDGENELLTLQNMHTDVDEVAQKTTSWLRYELWRDGKLADTQLQIGGMLYFGVAEFTQLLHDSGFTTVDTFGDYDPTSSPPAPSSQIWTFLATK